jgi:acyl-CoA synthetase (AMP-forming)/AMP-acid ligase II
VAYDQSAPASAGAAARGGGSGAPYRATYAELDAQSDAFARGLRQLGLVKGDRLGVWLPNVPAYTVAQIAAAKLGVVLVTVNPGYRAPELAYALKYVQPARGHRTHQRHREHLL